MNLALLFQPRTYILIGFLWLTNISTSPILSAQESNKSTLTLFDYFFAMGNDNPVIKINTNVGQLIKQKLKEEEQPAVFSFIGPEGNELAFDISIRTRGNMRKQVCNYPPLKANFKKKQLKANGFNKLDRLKLVLQCRDKNYGKTQLLKEHLIYELYSVIDTNCIRSKVILVELWDGDKLKNDLFGLLVEDEDQFAQRLNVRVLESGNVRSPSLQRDHYLKMAFFQYMIANTDWTVPNKHNIEIVKVPGIPRVVAIPYDFDYAGLVGTSYAVPHESLPINNVQKRHFMGYQVSLDEAKETAEFFKSIRPEFIICCQQATYLEEKERKNVEKYIDAFYKIISSEKQIKRKLVTQKTD